MLSRAACIASASSKCCSRALYGVRTLATEVPATSGNIVGSNPPPSRRNGRMLGPNLPEKDFSSQILHGRSVLSPLQHPKTHGIPVAAIHIRGHDHRSLELFAHFASHAAAALGIPFSTARLPTQRSLWTVPKGPFVHKKNQENFERRVHKRVMTAWDATDGVVESLLAYLGRYPQPGVGLRIVRWRRAPLGMGKRAEEARGEKGMESMKLDNVTNKQKVEELAKDIVDVEMKALGKGGSSKEVLERKTAPETST